MPERWIKDKTCKDGYTYKKIKEKRVYWFRARFNPIIVTFKSNLIKRGFYNDDS
jgi:hypothetical protein